MYQGNATTIDELVGRAQAIRDAARDFIVDTRAVTIRAASGDGEAAAHLEATMRDPGGSLHGPYRLTDHALAHLAGRCDPPVPVRYVRALLESGHGGPLAQATFNFLGTNAPSRQLVRCLDAADGVAPRPTCRAVLSSSYRRLDNPDVIEHALAPVFEGRSDLRIASAHVGPERMCIKVVSSELRDVVVPGGDDVVFAGVRIENSEAGLSALTATPFVLRQVCTNGMTVDVFKLKQIHLGRADKGEEAVRELFSEQTLSAESMVTFMKFRDVVTETLAPAGFSRVVAAMRQAAGERFDNDPSVVVDALAEVLALTEAERLLARGLAHAEEPTRWGIVNAITATAERAETYEAADRLEALGGQVLLMPAGQWRTVATAPARTQPAFISFSSN